MPAAAAAALVSHAHMHRCCCCCRSSTAAIPSVFDRIDFLASHSYPAQGIGWGFNVPLTQGMPGLKYYELELQHINRTVQVKGRRVLLLLHTLRGTFVLTPA